MAAGRVRSSQEDGIYLFLERIMLIDDKYIVYMCERVCVSGQEGLFDLDLNRHIYHVPAE